MKPQRFGEWREIVLHYISHDTSIYTKVLMNKDVSETSDLRPGNLRVLASEVRRKMIHGLTNDLHVAFDCIFCHSSRQLSAI
ncbi:MAG: hypothetical protein Q4G21_01310 [Dermabacter sp.]|nr:hypothetical protein [Dermabacter sp.]